MKILGYFFLLIFLLLAHVWKESKLAGYSVELNKLKTEKELLISDKEQLLGTLAVEASIVKVENKALTQGLVFPNKDEISEVWHR